MSLEFVLFLAHHHRHLKPYDTNKCLPWEIAENEDVYFETHVSRSSRRLNFPPLQRDELFVCNLDQQSREIREEVRLERLNAREMHFTLPLERGNVYEERRAEIVR